MNDINMVTLTGNLTADPELRATTGGTNVLNFRIASNYAVKNKQSGEWEDRANFVSCTVMGSRAEPLSRLIGKGDKVAVSGSLRYHSWEDKDGNRRSMLEVYADNVILMGKRGGKANESHGEPTRGPESDSQDMYSYDLPF